MLNTTFISFCTYPSFCINIFPMKMSPLNDRFMCVLPPILEVC